MSKESLNRSEKEEFLDNYFFRRLQDLLIKIGTPEIQDRKDHVEYILDSLMAIADEYQAVVVEDEEGYWDSIETWNEEVQLSSAVKWVNEKLTGKKI